MISANGSKAPVFTLPAWAQTMTGPSIAGERVAQGVRPHPALVVGSDLADAVALAPEPSIWSEA